MAEWLEASAAIARLDEEYERSARLLGAAAALREAMGAPLAPKDEAARDRLIESLRSELGEALLSANLDIGRALTWAQAATLGSEITEG